MYISPGFTWIACEAVSEEEVGYRAVCFWAVAALALWAALPGMTLGPQVFGHALLNWSLRHFSPSTVAFSLLLEPVIAALLAWVLLRQALMPVQMLGGLLVLAALALVIGQQTPQEQVQDEPVG